MLGVKSLKWSYESEVRLICDPAGKHEHDYRAVNAVYFGIRAKEGVNNKLMKALAGRGVSYYQINMDNNSYKLAAVKVADLFLNSLRYKYKIAPIDQGAINTKYLKPEQLKFEMYLQKAAEIVRRDPCCEKVISTDFSTADDSIIYVMYENKQNNPFNKFLTIDQIDREYALINDLS